MAEQWHAYPPRPTSRPPRPAPKPTTITECARRYHACALALAQSLGLSLADVLTQYHAAVASIYIETSRCELRLPAGIELPTLARMPDTPQAAPVADRADFFGEFPKKSAEAVPDEASEETAIRGRLPAPDRQEHMAEEAPV